MIHHLIPIVTSLLLVFSSYGIIPERAHSQNTITFDEGLAVPMSHNYSRTAVHTDKIEWQLIHGEFESPEAGQIAGINANGDTLRWHSVEVNDEGRFAGQAMRSGYLYLSFESDEEKVMWLHADGHNMAYVNGVPRAGDIYAYGYVYLPIEVQEGKNEILLRSARWGGIRASVEPAEKETGFLPGDLTLPHILSGEQEPLWGGVQIINSTSSYVVGAEIKTTLNGNEMVTELPSIPPMTVRKVPFQFDPSAAGEDQGDVDVELEIHHNGSQIDETTIRVTVMDPSRQYSRTFISEIDGSVQYYSVAPQAGGQEGGSALFLSVHGAEVEAISQARAYQPKDWGTLVAPTNRRPRGFNWEDWGRMDALEVLEIAKEIYNPDPQRIYLTGHSMGGHGTWYLGATYPNYWAAIAPAAGYPTLRGYGSHDGTVPDHDDLTDVESMLLRSSNPGDVMSLIPNYQSHGVYVLHGDADRVVSVEHARIMRYELGKFHPDFTYYEYPGGSHWYGNESVDWPPLFEFFRDRTIPLSKEKDEIQFITANPGISHEYHWAAVEQQIKPLEMSRFQIERDREENIISGSTENISRISFDLSLFDAGQDVSIELDDAPPIDHTVTDGASISLTFDGSIWSEAAPLAAEEKGPHRYGAFKEAFRDRMVFVYGTSGSAEENRATYNKARYDSETWYYRGNGAVDMVADRDFSPEEYSDRGVILYGNSDTNSAWSSLLAESPVQVSRDHIEVGNQRFEGDDLGTYFLYPRPDSDIANVAVISGTGVKGMKTVTGNQYYAGSSGFPDFMVFNSSMLLSGTEGVLSAGFFDNNWGLDSENTVIITSY
ncbi:MAG: prolyl oligopeptidase family serine peptidase [Balneolaceae bacterium]|nr:prolyl oligopeptidase family serine peptidase [Balneolaceae bacterium]